MNRKPKPKHSAPLKAVDFFCCAGGVTSGFRKAGISVLGGIDIEGIYKDTYEKNNKGSQFIKADISDLEPEHLEKTLGITKDMDDLIFVGCSPCQYYTNLQTDRTKSADSRMLLEEFKRFVEYFNPGYIFVENVPGLERKQESPLSEFKTFLSEKGYVFDEGVINAAEYNVPQNRKRYVLIASRVVAEIKIPKGRENKRATVRRAIGSMPAIESGHRDNKAAKHWTVDLEQINLTRLQHTSHDGGTRLEWKNNDALQLACYRNKDKTFTDVYGRMFWDQPSPTITTKFHSVSNGRFGHPEQNRGLSLREGALLQSFPKSYKFYADSIGVTARMIGNAVPPVLAMRIGQQLTKIHLHAAIQSESKSN